MTFPGTSPDDSNLNHLKDILQTYNRVTELCFRRCASNFNYRNLTSDEQSCVDSCSGKFIVGNQKIMSTFVEIQSVKQQQMLTDAANQQQQQIAEAHTHLPQVTSDTADASSNSQS